MKSSQDYSNLEREKKSLFVRKGKKKELVWGLFGKKILKSR